VLHLPTVKDFAEIRQALSEAGLPNLFIPSQDSFVEVDEIPMLGTGKLDLKRTRFLAAEKLGIDLP
jgi:acyl-[acyl-carrier-protein]-phospholipid O-acyltransferase/long-chain-fatty-acid--[acyl-carrier-protein] ligase